MIGKVTDIDWQHWQARDPATLVFVRDGGRLLLIRKKRGLGAGKINAPGGKVDPGETPRQCAVRECQEEVGITPLDLHYRGQNLFQFTDGYSIHVWVYVAERYSGTPVETEEAVPLWVDEQHIPYEQMWVDDKLWLPLVLRGELFRARWIFEGDNMIAADFAGQAEAADEERDFRRYLDRAGKGRQRADG